MARDPNKPRKARRAAGPKEYFMLYKTGASEDGGTDLVEAELVRKVDENTLQRISEGYKFRKLILPAAPTRAKAEPA